MPPGRQRDVYRHRHTVTQRRWGDPSRVAGGTAVRGLFHKSRMLVSCSQQRATWGRPDPCKAGSHAASACIGRGREEEGKIKMYTKNLLPTAAGAGRVRAPGLDDPVLPEA